MKEQPGKGGLCNKLRYPLRKIYRRAGRQRHGHKSSAEVSKHKCRRKSGKRLFTLPSAAGSIIDPARQSTAISHAERPLTCVYMQFF